MDDPLLSVRPYRDADLPVLQEAMAGWIATAGRCGYDHIGELPHRIYDNPGATYPVEDLVQVWQAGGRIAGVGIYLRFGAAFDVFVAPALRGGPAEEQIVETAARATARLMRPGTRTSHVLTDVFGCDAARIGVLERLGFQRHRVWDDITERELAGPVPAVVLPDGYTLRSARHDEADRLAEVRNRSFGTAWTGAALRERVLNRPGYDPEREIVIQAPDGRLAAFTQYWTDTLNRTGHFEPVGTHRDFQRRGLARAMLLEAMARMRAEGMTLVSVNHNATNTPARALYASLGFTRRCGTLGYRRTLPPPVR